MPENSKENDTQPVRSIDSDLDFRTRFAASSDVSESKRANRTLRIIAEGTAAATGEEFFRSLARCAAQALSARYAWETNWRIEGEQGAAKLLNLQPSTLRSRMQKLGIVRHAD